MVGNVIQDARRFAILSLGVGLAAAWQGAAAVAAAGALPPFHAAVAADEPVLWYRFDEPPGSRTAANSGSLGAAYDGDLVNGVSLGAESPVGDGAAEFDHLLAQHLDSGAVAPPFLLGNPTFTAEAVVRIAKDFVQPTPPGWPPFLHWGGPATGQSIYFSLWSISSDRFYVGFYNGGLRTVSMYPPGQFYHLVWVRDSAGGAAGQWTGSTLYVNGVPVALEPDPLLPGAPTIAVTATSFRVQRATDFARYFSGVVDEVVLYDRALAPEEVAAHFAALDLGAGACPEDLTGDGEVGGADLGLLLSQWGQPGSGDLDGSGLVDGADLGLLLGAWGACQ